VWMFALVTIRSAERLCVIACDEDIKRISIRSLFIGFYLSANMESVFEGQRNSNGLSILLLG